MRWWVFGIGCQGPNPDGLQSDSGSLLDPPIGPITARCEDPGPDAPVVARTELVETSFEGDALVSWLPQGLRAVVFYFYGSNDVIEWNGPEQTAFANQMFDAGIGYVVYAKANPAAGASWNSGTTDFASNEDLSRLERLREHLVATTPLEEDTPILSAGFSDGGAFAVFFATEVQKQRGWPVAAVLVHNSSGGGRDLPDVPIWATASAFDAAPVRSAVESLAEEQSGRGFPSAFRLVEERPLTPEVLLRHAPWDAEKVAEMHQDLVTFGLVDAAGTRLVGDDQIEPALGAYVNQSLEPAAPVSAERARVVWATHRYSAFYTKEECDFALDALGL